MLVEDQEKFTVVDAVGDDADAALPLGPIILVGTHRAGTTWLGHLFSRHADLAYYGEPRHVWSWGNSYKPDDVLTAADARPKVVRHIRATFQKFVAEQGKKRLCEKTPNSCLRLSFIRAVYPEAKILFVIRDGRAVIRSTTEMLEAGPQPRLVLQRARQTPLWEWPAYAIRDFRTLSRKLLGRRLEFWGPRPPGWRSWIKQDPPHVLLAKQWVATIGHALADARAMDPSQLLEFRYEDLVRDPREVMRRIVDFLELPDADDLVEAAARTADASCIDKWRQGLSAETLEEVRPHVEPMLDQLGYEW